MVRNVGYRLCYTSVKAVIGVKCSVPLLTEFWCLRAVLIHIFGISVLGWPQLYFFFLRISSRIWMLINCTLKVTKGEILQKLLYYFCGWWYKLILSIAVTILVPNIKCSFTFTVSAASHDVAPASCKLTRIKFIPGYLLINCHLIFIYLVLGTSNFMMFACISWSLPSLNWEGD